MMKTNRVLKILLDFFVLLCVLLPLISVWIWMEAYHRGYFADDLSLRLPSKPDTISEIVLTVVGFALIIVTVVILEVIHNKKGRNAGADHSLGGASIPGWLWDSYNTIGIFTFGAACQQFTAEFTKRFVGRLRPNFFDICRPVPTINSALNTLGYIQDFTCTNSQATEYQLHDMRLSFPSAHSSFAMYVAVFFICYVQYKGKWRHSKLLRHLMQFCAIIAAWYVGLTRIQDHKHHWSDVASGYFNGAAFGVLVFIYVLKPKKQSPLWEEPTMPPAHMLPRPVLTR